MSHNVRVPGSTGVVMPPLNFVTGRYVLETEAL